MTEDLINRITYHLSSGGLFNPELADHLAVRNLLMECREALAQPEQEPVAYLCENAVGHKYFRWKKPSSTYKPIALYTKENK